ncbi:MAG: type II toxin-antitoxin system HicA family toxin [Anaerolineae bacterium]|nr:type II toxin-antitoxin system HicA family toxin [Anaerolineae bacterium]
MTKRDKLRRKLRNNPKGVRFSDLETLLLQFGFELARVKGSHHVFEYHRGQVQAILVVPTHANEVKAQYIRDTLAVLDELFPEERNDDGE